MLRNIRNQEKLYILCANKKFGTENYIQYVQMDHNHIKLRTAKRAV